MQNSQSTCVATVASRSYIMWTVLLVQLCETCQEIRGGKTKNFPIIKEHLGEFKTQLPPSLAALASALHTFIGYRCLFLIDIIGFKPKHPLHDNCFLSTNQNIN